MGTDIQDNKCSWLVVQALERADTEQKALLLENYAVDEEDKVGCGIVATTVNYCVHVCFGETPASSTSFSPRVLTAEA